jgi:hypothetical protein
MMSGTAGRAALAAYPEKPLKFRALPADSLSLIY